MTFELRPLLLTFRASQAVHFPPGKAANVLRGALGTTLRRTSCTPECQGATICPFRQDCAYARLFEPTTTGEGPSGLMDWPRPFVLRAAHLDGQTLTPGQEFSLGVNLFDLHPHAPLHLVRALSQLIDTGLGPSRGSVELTEVSICSLLDQPVQHLYSHGRFIPASDLAKLAIPLEPPANPVTSVTLHFRTPTEIKGVPPHGTTIPFGPLFARLRDRISNLRRLYGAGALDIAYRQLGDLAHQVTVESSKLRHSRVERFSTKNQQTHQLGGILGEITYTGNLTPFVPYLHLAHWTGVGKHTVWGNGHFSVIFPDVPYSEHLQAVDNRII